MYIYIYTYIWIHMAPYQTNFQCPRGPKEGPRHCTTQLTTADLDGVWNHFWTNLWGAAETEWNPHQPKPTHYIAGGYWLVGMMKFPIYGKTKHVPNHHANIFVRPPKNNNDLHHHLVKGAQNEAVFLKLGQHVHQLELGILRHRKMA